MYRKILVPVDIADLVRAEKSLRQAASLLDSGGEIILLNVVENLPSYMTIDVPGDLIGNAVTEATQRLEALDAAAGFGDRIAIRNEIRQGAPAREILAAADDHAADLIIVASHVPDFSNYFISATADRIVRHAKCAVLVDR